MTRPNRVSMAATPPTSSVPPARKLGKEIQRRGELDIHCQLLLQGRDPTQGRVRVRLEPDVDVNRRLPPSLQHCGPAPAQVHPRPRGNSPAERRGEPPDPLGVSAFAHALPLARNSRPERG